MRVASRSLLCALVLLAWTAPAMGALALTLHLALDHHGPRAGHHQSDVSELLWAAVHGHHHDVETGPVHEHDVRLDGGAPGVRTVSPPAADLPPSTYAPSGRSAKSLPDGSPRRAPPQPPFASHCSMLL